MNIFLAGTYSRANVVFEGPEMKIYLAGNNYKKDCMDVYLAGEHDVKNGKAAESDGVMVLESYVYARTNKHIKALIPTFKSFLLDSGAFTFMVQAQKQSVSIDWESYIDQYAEFIRQYNVDLFFELDIDVIVGVDKVELLRARLESLTGKPSIPVWHRKRGLDYWKRMCREYKYVSFSASGKNGSSEWVRTPDGVKAMRKLIDIAHENGAKVHALGYTNLRTIRYLKMDSVDSTSWLMGNRGGFLYFFTGSGIVKKFKPAGTRLKAREAAVHNFWQWVKFQKYAEANL